MSKKKVTGGKATAKQVGKRLSSAASRTLKIRGTTRTSKSTAGSALTQRASQVKSSAKTGKISRTAARSIVLRVSQKGNDK